MAQRQNILLVDPNHHDLQLLDISLRNMGFAVTAATGAADALKKIEVSPPDLIISETLVGEFDGFALCRKVKEEKTGALVPFLFLSSDKTLQSKVKGLQMGVDDYLTKPIFLVELMARIKMLLQRREREQLEKQESRTRFSGSLGEIGLVDIIQTIDLSKKRGMIHLSREGETGAIYFEEGEMVDAELGHLEGEEALYRLLRWTDGFFDIEFRAIRRERRITGGVQHLLMEGLRRLDDWNRIIEQLPPLETVFSVDPKELIERLDEIPDEVNALVAMFDGCKSLEEIVKNDIFSDLDTLRIVSKLIFFGVLVEARPKEPVCEPMRESAASFGEKKTAETVKLPIFPPTDLQFGRAEGVDIVQMPLAKPSLLEKKERKEPRREDQEEAAPQEGGEVKVIPVAIISAEKPAPPEAEPPAERKEVPLRPTPVVQVGAAEEAAAQKKAIEEKVRMTGLPPIVPAAPVPAPAPAPAAADAGVRPEPVLSALDSNIERLKAGKGQAVEERARAAGVDGSTARLYGGESADAAEGGDAARLETPVEERGVQTQRWTFPTVTSEAGQPEERGEKERKAVERVEVHREAVQGISLKDIKEHIEKKEGGAHPRTDSGLYRIEEKEFFHSAPEGTEAVDTFDDLVVKERKREDRKKGYAGWLVVGILVVGIAAYFIGKSAMESGPDMSLLGKLDQVETVQIQPLKTESQQAAIQEEAGGKAAGEEKAPAAQEEGSGEAKQEEGSGEAKQEEGKGEEGAAAVEPAPAPVPAAASGGTGGAYDALVAEAQELLKKKDRKGAAKKYEEAVQANPDGVEALAFLVDHFKERPTDAVLAWGKRATELAPGDARSWFGYGLALFIKGKKGDAKAAFEACLAITPPDASVKKCKQMIGWVK